MRLINLIPLHEIDFRNQAAFDTYNKQHKLRPDTKVNIAGKNTTAGQASKIKGTSVFGGSKKPFSGGVDVLDTVQKLLPVGTGFTDKKTGNKILIKGYKDNDMLVSHDKYPNKILKWPLKQFFKLDTKRFQFHPKPKENDTNKVTQQYNPAQAFNQKVSKMTDNNAHSAAAVELAIYMDDKEAVSKLQQIKKYHDNRGYLQPGEAKERGEIVNNLLQRAQKELPKKDFDLVSGAF